DQKIRNVVLIGSQGSLEDKTVTVCYGADFVNVTFMWTDELFALAYNLNQYNNPTIKFLEKLHTKIVLKADKSGKILVKNIIRLFAQNKEDKKRVEKALSESGLPTGKTDTISQSKFHTDGKPHLSATQLVDFLNEVQRDPRLNEILHPYADLQRAKDLIKTYEHNKYQQQRSQLTFDGFLRFLMSEDNPIVAPNKLDLCDDMEQPMAHYFINSSHNTYLTGHQITGKSSVEIYRQSLLAGCRCVELDFWNGRTEEPVIVHGYTFVPEINAKEVLEAIAESAFKTSNYPVILSFENHCNPRQQAKIANYCREIFGDMLLDKPLDSHPLQPGGELPPPSFLKNKIIIKNKKKHHHHHHKKEETVVSDEAEQREVQPQGNGDISHGQLVRQGSSESSGTDSSSEEESAVGGAEGPCTEDVRESHAAAEISALVNYVQPVHFSSFENAEKKNRFYEMSSFDEKQATTLLKERPIEFVNYNKHQLSRVYPAGTRFDSSNFMPQVFWNAGCQLVALNYQTLDLAMQLNLGTFEYNRRCGYMLKPEFMRRKDRRLDPFAESMVDGIIAGSLSVSVVSGQLLTDKRCGTFVEVDMYGLPADTVVLPELAMLRVAAHEEGGRLLGHRVLPVPGLRPGLRHVGLRTELGLPLPATLLLHIRVTDYVPDKLSELAEALANPIKYQNEMEKRTYQLSVLTDDAEEMTAPDIPKPAPAVTLTVTEETETKWNGTNTEISAEETLNALFNSKVVKDKRSELARKGDNSVVSEEGNPGVSSGGGEERELRLRYHHQIYAALEKNLRNQHQQQMKALTDLLDSEKKEILNRLANSRKEDVKALAKETIRDKDEILRRKREIHTLSVQRGVTECSRLELAHMQRRELLMLAHERLTAMLQRYREQELSELEQLCGGAPEG
ncbi:unnamed protein product, partial [Leptidea sinapis]